MQKDSTLVRRKPETVKEFQEMNDRIYTWANKRYSDEHLVLRLLEEICVTSEIARKDILEQMPAQLARIFSWWCAVGNRLKLDLQATLWHKYPAVCPYCIRPKNCSCGIEHPEILSKEETLRRLRMERIREPKTLVENQLLHNTLYREQNKRLLTIQVVGHLIEEGGEVSREFRHNNIPGLCDEMADVASWMFGIANRREFDLAETVWRQYPYECERCHENVCVSKCTRASRII